MRTIEIITKGEPTTYNADVIRAVSMENSQVYDGYSWVRINIYPLTPINIKLRADAAEKLYLSVKAFMKSETDGELIVQLSERDGGGERLVAIQTIQK